MAERALRRPASSGGGALHLEAVKTSSSGQRSAYTGANATAGKAYSTEVVTGKKGDRSGAAALITQHWALNVAVSGSSCSGQQSAIWPHSKVVLPLIKQVMRDKAVPLVANSKRDTKNGVAQEQRRSLRCMTGTKIQQEGTTGSATCPSLLGCYAPTGPTFVPRPTHHWKGCQHMSETVKRPPVSVYAEMTPNPTSMRFVSSRMLVDEGRLLEFRDPKEPVGISPLAEHVFNLPFVTAVFISSNFITVTRNNSITWDLVQLELREYIQDYLNSDGRVVNEDAPSLALADANERATTHAPAQGPDDEKIINALEEYIRPAVEGDGGHIAFKSFEDGIVTVSLRGSCSGCPSSMITLKQGIENLLKHEVPGVREVVAEEL